MGAIRPITQTPVIQTSEDPVLSRPQTGPIDFSRNLPFVGESSQALAATLADLVRAGDFADYLDHERGDVALRHRRAGAAWIARSGLSTGVENIILTCGAQQGIFATLAAVLHPGDILLTEALSYAPVKAIARHLGVRIVGLPMDGDGILPDAIEAACRRHPARALYITPTLQTPTAVTMGGEDAASSQTSLTRMI
ncbi:MAG: aminotransferase class I/II-fold pyridoxal phosphate-dependent enzyme [Rhizobiaceae bacterium]|nr:aminotransferase class I/II-fold pyridoxal phosphate-dependent enzyme [Rhizobiaceae bacterium]